MGKIKIDRDRCKGCYLCVVNCPAALIKIEKKLNAKGVKAVYYEAPKGNSKVKCTGCGMCALVCPDCVIEVYR